MSLLLLPVPRPCRRSGLDLAAQRRAGRPRRNWLAEARQQVAKRINLGAARAFGAQVLVVFGLMEAYHFARALADGKTSVAFDHSSEVWRWERMFHLPSELSLQHWVLHHPSVAELANYYYMGVHFPFTGAVLVYFYLRRRSVYLPMRNTLVLLTAAGLVLAFVFPLAPPRMRGDLGFTDVAATFGQSVYGPVGSGTANQFAAMPSLHVGWAVLVGLSLVAAGRSRWRWLWLAHPVLTIAVVVGTANHYWADGIVAGALLGLAAAPVLLLSSRRRAAATPVDVDEGTVDEGTVSEGAVPEGAPPCAPAGLVPAARDRNHPFGTDASPGSGAQPARP
jgi:hypothetical protein